MKREELWEDIAIISAMIQNSISVELNQEIGLGLFILKDVRDRLDIIIKQYE